MKKILATILATALGFGAWGATLTVGSSGADYATLKAAFDAAGDGDTIQLLADVEVSSSTSLGKTLTLDLNGYKITASATLFNIYNSSVELTIKDSSANGTGAIDVSADKIVYVSSGKLTLEGGALSAHSSASHTCGVQVGSSGTFVMTGGSITIPSISTSTYNYCVNNSGTTTITGGSMTAEASGGNYTVSGTGGTITIEGGTFVAKAYAAGLKSPYVLYGSGAKIVTGGYFQAIGDSATYSAGYLVDGSATISGGYFGGTYYYGLPASQIDQSCVCVLNTDEATKAAFKFTVVPAVARVGTTKYANLMEAVNVAYNGGTVELLADVTVDHWHQNIWTLVDGVGDWGTSPRVREPTAGPNGLTINGNGHNLTINGIDSAVNCPPGTDGLLFMGARNLTITDLTINAGNRIGAIGMVSGIITGVRFNMGDSPAIYTSGINDYNPGEHIEIRNCVFNSKDNTYGIYNDAADEGVEAVASGAIISGNTFNTYRSVALRSDMQFLNNTVNGAKGVTVASGSTAVVRGNIFADTTTSRSINVYPSNATIENNVILGPIELENKTYETAPDLSGNYWGGDAPANLPEGVVCNTYYDTCTMYDSPAQDGSLFELSGIHPDIEISDPEAQDGATETSATYNVNVTVDGQSAGTQSVTVSVAADDIAHTTLSSVKLDSVLTAVIAAQGTDASAVTEVEILVSAVDTNTVNETIVYDVKPEAIVTVTKGNVSTQSEPIELSNDDLAPGASFTIQLDVTPLGAKAGDSVKVAHESDDPNYADETYFVQAFAGADDKVYVRFTVSHFSTFTLSLLSTQPVTTSVQSVNLFGAIKIVNNASNMFVAVPFEGFEAAGAARKAKDAVHPAGLADGTKMYVYDDKAADGGKYDVFEVSGDAWTKASKVTIGASGTVSVDDPNLDRPLTVGSGVIVDRTSLDAPVYVYGQLPSVNSLRLEEAGASIICVPSTNVLVDVDLNALTWSGVTASGCNTAGTRLNSAQKKDVIRFRGPDNKMVEYYYFSNKWGPVYRSSTWNGEAVVPAGTAFWYTANAAGVELKW